MAHRLTKIGIVIASMGVLFSSAGCVTPQAHGSARATSGVPATQNEQQALAKPVLRPETDSDPAEYDVGPGDELPGYDNYVTWADAPNDASNVEYSWDGRAIGYGEAGIQALVRNLLATRPGSKVLFYPDFRFGPTGGGLFLTPPYFGDAEAELRAAARQRHLTMIYSQRDRFGRLVPKPR